MAPLARDIPVPQQAIATGATAVDLVGTAWGLPNATGGNKRRQADAHVVDGRTLHLLWNDPSSALVCIRRKV